jgi:hypothetical protein
MDLDLRSGFFEEKLESSIGRLTAAFDERVANSPPLSTAAPAASTAS